MDRAATRLSGREWDVLVIGGGIHGAFVAREAALRGLSTVLLEKGDFASATSSHSQKILHSGLRYLQHGDIVRLRRSVVERTVLMRVAPHLVRPLPVLVPAYGHGMRGREALAAAVALHNLAGIDRNRGLHPRRRIPRGRTVGAGECRRLFPEAEPRGLTGAAIWYDGQIADTERMVLSLLHDLCSRGGHARNYTKVTAFQRKKGRICGVAALDLPSGDIVDVRARVTVNAAGPWLGEVCRLAGVPPPEPSALSRAMVLVVGRALVRDFAVGLRSPSRFDDPDVLVRRGERLFFITPWRGMSLVGSAHLPFDGSPDSCAVSGSEIAGFLDEVNRACPPWGIGRQEVLGVYRGLLPTAGADPSTGSVQVEKSQRIVDHAASDGLEGLLSVLGVKYTTARDAAARAVDLAGRKLGLSLPPSRSAWLPVHGGEEPDPEALLARCSREAPRGVPPEVLRHLADSYGSASSAVLGLLREDRSLGERVHPDLPVIAAEVVHGIREEMALGLTDILLRRTVLASAGHPGRETLERCAALAGREMGWDAERSAREVEAAGEALTLPGGP